MIHKKYKKFPYKIENGILLIPVTNKFKAKPEYYAKASLEDKDKLLQYTYRIFKGRCTNYAISNLNILIHALVINEKVPPGHDIDHKDRDGLNNTRENLSVITKSANAQNKDKKLNCSSKYVGVYFKKGKWHSRIRINGIIKNLGLFKNEKDAGKAYDIHAINQYGLRCKTNNLLHEDEINDIVKNGIPKGWEIKNREKKDKDLPMYIKRVGKKYQVEYKKSKLKKTVETLEEAILLKDKLIKENEDKKLKKETERRENIIRNSDGFAVIYIKNKNKEIVYEIIVDDYVWAEVSSFSWHLVDEFYARSWEINSTMHRYIYQKYIGEIPEDKSIDHIESSRIFDNRLCNLRLASASLQNHNKEKNKNSIDKYKGVYFDKTRFCVFINSKIYGCYDNAEEAAFKANKIFREIYGEDAFQNKIDFSVKTTKHNRIKEEDVTEEYINNIKFIKDLRNIIMIKKLNIKAGGIINTSDLKRDTLDEFKTKVIDLLFKS